MPPPAEMTTAPDRNWWNVIWESYAGPLFFATGSSLECFAHAMNALGYLLSATDFVRLRTRLYDIIDLAEDQVLFLPLTEGCLRQMEAIGRPTDPHDKNDTVIVL